MTTIEVLQTEAPPRVLADGEVYAVKVTQKNGTYYVSGVDEDGYPNLSNIATCFTETVANEVAAKVGRFAKVVPIRADRDDDTNHIYFWISNKNFPDHYSSRRLRIGTPARGWRDEIPGWFVAAMMKFAPDEEWGEDTGGDATDETRALDVFTSNICTEWADHTGWSGEGEDSVFVAEPYGLGPRRTQSLINDCQKFGFKFSISGKSSHYPSSTIRIEISPIEKLTYVKRVKNYGPLRTAWEAKRSLIFKTVIRQNCIDSIEHVARVVANVEHSKDGIYQDYQMFVDAAIGAARAYIDEIRDDGVGDSELLEKYHQGAEKRLREMNRTGSDAATRHVFYALSKALASDDQLNGMTASGVSYYCNEAIDSQSQDGGARCKEAEWQQATHEKIWAGYYEVWSDEHAPEETL